MGYELRTVSYVYRSITASKLMIGWGHARTPIYYGLYSFSLQSKPIGAHLPQACFPYPGWATKAGGNPRLATNQSLLRTNGGAGVGDRVEFWA